MNESKATRYQRNKRRAEGAGVVCGGLMLAILTFTPAGSGLAAWASGMFGPGWPGFARVPGALTVFTVIVILLWEAALLPALWYLNARVDAKYGRRASLGELVATQAQSAIVAVPAALVAAASVHLSARLAGPWWWLLAGSLIGLALAGAMYVAPGVLARASGARPVERPALVERLGVLARRVRVSIASIDELPDTATVTATALVAGAGERRRVFIAAELMRDWTDEEITVVVAHELAHHAHHDLWRTLALDLAVLAAGFWVADIVLAWEGAPGVHPEANLAALPPIALVTSAVWLLTTPLRHALSRRQERQADAFALGLTDGAGAFQAAIRRLAARHLAEERPSRLTRWFYHRHPSAAERLRVAEGFSAVADRREARR